VKVTVLGCGSIGQRHVRGVYKMRKTLGVEQITVFDINKERMHSIKKELGGICISESLNEAIQDADTVFLCISTSAHIPVYKELKKHGSFHLFIEKPLSHDLEGCDQLIFDQSKSDKKTIVGYFLRLHPLLLEVQSMIQKKCIGDIVNLRVECGAYLPLWHPWEDYRDFYMSWKVGGGGALLDISHEIDYIQWLFGDIEDIQGYFGQFSNLEITSDDLALAICKFKNGIIGEIHLDLLQHSKERFLKIVGNDGVIIADLVKDELRVYLNNEAEWSIKKFNTNFDDIYDEEYKKIFETISGQDHNLASAEDGLRTMQVIEGIRRSSSTGQRIKLPFYS
jgi:predicted dehydrogenase